MPAAKVNSSRRERRSYSISQALAVSLMLHLLLVAGLELGQSLGLFDTGFSLLGNSQAIKEVLEESARREAQKKQEQVPEAELVFVDVDPSQATPEPPKDTPFYSAQNTRAANPDPTLDLQVPKIDGKQENVVKTTDTLRPDPAPPEAPKPEPQPVVAETPVTAEPPKVTPQVEEEKPEVKPEGEMLFARAAPRPQPKPEPPSPPPKPVRPQLKTVARAKADKGIIEGPKMRQEGGVRRHGLATTMDVRATPFGAYDAAFIAAVQARWYGLLDERDYVGNQAGKVTVEFNLHQDGRITSLRVAEASVSETLSWFCQRAILDPAPYAPFPPDLRRMLQRDTRPVRFTFYYNQ